MKPTIYPMKGLPAGLTGRIEVTDVFAKRDWRDDAMGWAATIAAGLAAVPLIFDYFPVGILLAIVLIMYVLKAIGELRVFTPPDSVTFLPIVEREDALVAQDDGEKDGAAAI